MPLWSSPFAWFVAIVIRLCAVAATRLGLSTSSGALSANVCASNDTNRRKTYIFDVVGTLADEVGTVRECLKSCFEISAERAALLAESWQSTLGQAVERVVDGTRPWQDYEALRSAALTDMLNENGLVADTATLKRLHAVGYSIIPFPGAADELTALSSRARVIGLTNTTLAAASTFSAAGGLRWHALLSTESIRSFKPQSAAYDYAIEVFDLQPEDCIFVAAHPWDLRAASSHGFRTAYFPRPHAAEAESSDSFDFTIRSLDDLR